MKQSVWLAVASWWGEGLASWPDEPFHNFGALRSGDRRVLCSSGTSCDRSWSSKIVKGFVGDASCFIIPFTPNSCLQQLAWRCRESHPRQNFQSKRAWSLIHYTTTDPSGKSKESILLRRTNVIHNLKYYIDSKSMLVDEFYRVQKLTGSKSLISVVR